MKIKFAMVGFIMFGSALFGTVSGVDGMNCAYSDSKLYGTTISSHARFTIDGETNKVKDINYIVTVSKK